MTDNEPSGAQKAFAGFAQAMSAMAVAKQVFPTS